VVQVGKRRNMVDSILRHMFSGRTASRTLVTPGINEMTREIIVIAPDNHKLLLINL